MEERISGRFLWNSCAVILVRRNIGMVLQEPFLYSRTIRENIAASRPDATMEEIREAARIACVDDAVMSFPDGYETLVGERGVTLSGGQRQRVAIARMLLQTAPIMVFDDSLSAVDSETDHKIRQTLKECMKNTTVILISHRITTLMGASQILVLNQGKMEEMGTHQELIERAIARMLLQKAPIMVFDDSLSAVDSETDHKIRQALKECMKNTTVILISHRITTLMGASQILVLNQGKMEEMGTHQELIERNGIYRQVYEIQMSHDDRKEVRSNGSL